MWCCWRATGEKAGLQDLLGFPSGRGRRGRICHKILGRSKLIESSRVVESKLAKTAQIEVWLKRIRSVTLLFFLEKFLDFCLFVCLPL